MAEEATAGRVPRDLDLEAGGAGCEVPRLAG